MTREEMILENRNLVPHVAKKWRMWDDYEDILQVGTIGLIKAVDSFKQSKGIAFSTYAVRCIHNELYKYMRYLNAQKRTADIVSLDILVGKNQRDPWIELIEGRADVEQEVVDRELLGEIDQRIRPRARRIARKYIAGYAKSEIAKSEDITCEGVRASLKRTVGILQRCAAI